MRKLMAIVLILAVAASGGCSPRKKRAGSRKPDVDTVPARGEKTSSAPSATDLKQKIRAAVIPVSGLASIGGPSQTDEPDEEDVFRLGRVCGADLPTDEIGDNHGMERSWQAQKYWTNHLVTGNAKVTAKEAIDAVKT